MSTEDRLSQRLAIALLLKAFPPDQVANVIDRVGAREQRDRDLPATVTVYFTLALWLFPESGYEHVMARVTDALAWAGCRPSERRVPRASSLARARDRLGPHALRALLGNMTRPTDTAEAVGAYWRGMRVVSADGMTLETPDTPENLHAWGRPVGERSVGRLPQLRLFTLAECGIETVVDAALGPCALADGDLLRQLLGHLGPGMVLLADLGALDHDLWNATAETGSALVWRVPVGSAPPAHRRLSDGTYLSYPEAPTVPENRPRWLRVINFSVDGEAREHSLVTTLTDPIRAPWRELAMLFLERWRLPTMTGAFDPDWCGAQRLRSRTALGVEQEIWALLCIMNVIRNLLGPASPPQCGAVRKRMRLLRT